MAFGSRTAAALPAEDPVAEEWWCQGYSEPGAGSDLASLKMRADARRRPYVLNGQKTWTTLGQYADMIFCLVRTDTGAQAGGHFLPAGRMKTPGITVRPIIMMDGEHEVNEVFFENVRVPVENLIGEENKGWTYAKYLLGHERTNIAGSGPRQARAGAAEAYRTEHQEWQADAGRPGLRGPRGAGWRSTSWRWRSPS